MKQLMIGNAAVARGLYEAGCGVASSYPGTPSTEITEEAAKYDEIYCEWAPNEKVALEVAFGAAVAGKRSFCGMKHVGLNVAADPLFTISYTGINAGMIIGVADDAGMHSSQNEQDSRFYGKFALVPTFEPSTQQEAYEMVQAAFDFSEKYRIPVLMRLTTRMAHSRAMVEPREARPENSLAYPARTRQWVLMPGNSRVRYEALLADYARFEEEAAASPFNRYADAEDKSLGIIACGIAYNYLAENYPDGCPHPVLKISQYPLPQELVRRMASECGSLLIIEEGQPVVEQAVRGILPAPLDIRGRMTGQLPRTGELTPDSVRAALGLAPHATHAASQIVVPRPPALCQGCGHRDVYTALKEIADEHENAKVFSDIGCYTLGWLAPFHAIDTCVDMGASITMAKGAADAGVYPSIAVIGDSVNTARYAGMNVGRIMMRTMFLSGAICGLVGFMVASGANMTLSDTVAAGNGFTAITVAWLSQLNAFAMIIISLMLAILSKGAETLQTRLMVPTSISDIITGILLFCMLGCEFFINYQIIFRGKSSAKEGAKV